MAKDLQYYTVGMLPLFQFATMNVKPIFLEIIEHYFVPLGVLLTPAINGFVVCLISGLEEKGGEFYNKSLSLLRMISGATSPTLFYGSVWKVLLKNANLRAAALNFLVSELTIDTIEGDMDMYLPDKSRLVLNALIHSLRDDDLLVKRDTLELLVQVFPLNAEYETDSFVLMLEYLTVGIYVN